MFQCLEDLELLYDAIYGKLVPSSLLFFQQGLVHFLEGILGVVGLVLAEIYLGETSLAQNFFYLVLIYFFLAKPKLGS
mgnify:CR=1 FL=1